MSEEVQAPADQLESGTYEVIRRRLEEQGRDLGERVEQLNGRRQELFGGTSIELQTTLHVTTEHNCVPRDLVRLTDDTLLFGYQVFFGLKSEVRVQDVFAVLDFADDHLDIHHGPELEGEQFLKDFGELFQYYKDARLLQLRRTETQLLMVFQTGQRETDWKVLRWSHGTGTWNISITGVRGTIPSPRVMPLNGRLPPAKIMSLAPIHT